MINKMSLIDLGPLLSSLFLLRLQHKMLTISDYSIAIHSIEYLPLPAKAFDIFFLPPLLHHVFHCITRCVHRTRYVSSHTGRYYQHSSSDCWMDPTPLQGLHTLPVPLTWSPLPHTLWGQANLTVLCSFAPALSISRLRANLHPNPAGLPHSPRHTLQR